MTLFSVVGNAILLVLALLGCVVFALPVIKDMNDGSFAAVHGAGPASAAMVYVLLVPVLSTLTNSLPARFLSLGLAIVAALVTRTWVDLLEAGQAGAAFAVLATVGMVAAGGVVLLRKVARYRRRKVRDIARRHAVLAGEIGDALRQRYGGSQADAHRNDSLRQVMLADHLIFGVIGEAAIADTLPAYAETLRRGLDELQSGLEPNPRTDPAGHGAVAVAEYATRLRADLARRVPEPSHRPRRPDHQNGVRSGMSPA